MSRDDAPDDEREPDRDADDERSGRDRRAGADDDPDRRGDPDDDEPEHPNYTWEGGESGWRAENEPTDRGREGRKRDRRTGGRRESDRRARPPRDASDRRGAPDRPDAPRPERRVDAASEPTRTRENVGWNFDSPHSHHGARHDQHERRSRTRPTPTNRLDGDDGIKHLDWERKGPFDFAFSYPLQRGWGPLLKAGAVVLASPLLVFLPLVFLFGYVFRLTRYAAQGRTQPAFEEFGPMLTDGIGYVLVFTLAWAVWLVGVVLGAMLHDAVAWIFALVGFYLFPAVLTVYPVTGSVTKTFSSSLTFDFAFTRHYLKYALLYIVLLIALRIVASFSVLLLIIGVAWGWAFTYLANGAYWGFVYYDGASDGVLPSPEDVDQRDEY